VPASAVATRARIGRWRARLPFSKAITNLGGARRRGERRVTLPTLADQEFSAGLSNFHRGECLPR